GRTKRTFNPTYHGFMVSIGGRYAVAHIMNIRLSGFIAMMMKHLINIHYLWGIAGFNASWTYIQHHFLEVPDSRSVFGNHLSYHFRIFWIVILRVFLGAMWIREGMLMLKENPNIKHIRLPLSHMASNEVTATMPHGLANAITYLTDHTSAITGEAIVFTVGALLITGLLTLPASIISIIVCIISLLSGNSSTETVWFLAASIVMLGGAGQGFGIDAFITPRIKKWWRGTSFAKRTHLYLGEPRK
ncbi:MAG TPA: hypothetical protein VF857_07070, partial [Spirochaetota bacterium]